MTEHHCTVTYERQDALDASSFFMDMNEQGRGAWRVAVGLFGILIFAIAVAAFVIPGQIVLSARAHEMTFVVAVLSLSWSVDPAFRDFTRRLWLPRGRTLTADFSDAGVTIQRNEYGSRFTAWSDVASVTERADGILLVFKDQATPVPGMNPWYRHFTWMIGSPILWLPTRTFVNYAAKWELRDFARRFVAMSADGDTSFFRFHIATLVVMALIAIASFGIPSCESKLHESQFRRGLRYLAGDGVVRDNARGVELIREAARGGVVEAQEKIAEFDRQIRVGQAQPTQETRQHIADNYAADAISRYVDAADQGDAQAQYKLGDLYESGYGVPKNPVAALEWYTKAANHGNSLAQDRLGHIYDEGIGVPRNGVAAVEWYRKAAEQGEVLDQFKLGQIYSDGSDVPKDMAEAIKWYRKASEQGFGAATDQLRALGEKR